MPLKNFYTNVISRPPVKTPVRSGTPRDTEERLYLGFNIKDIEGYIEHTYRSREKPYPNADQEAVRKAICKRDWLSTTTIDAINAEDAPLPDHLGKKSKWYYKDPIGNSAELNRLQILNTEKSIRVEGRNFQVFAYPNSPVVTLAHGARVYFNQDNGEAYTTAAELDKLVHATEKHARIGDERVRFAGYIYYTRNNKPVRSHSLNPVFATKNNELVSEWQNGQFTFRHEVDENGNIKTIGDALEEDQHNQPSVKLVHTHLPRRFNDHEITPPVWNILSCGQHDDIRASLPVGDPRRRIKYDAYLEKHPLVSLLESPAVAEPATGDSTSEIAVPTVTAPAPSRLGKFFKKHTSLDTAVKGGIIAAAAATGAYAVRDAFKVNPGELNMPPAAKTEDGQAEMAHVARIGQRKDIFRYPRNLLKLLDKAKSEGRNILENIETLEKAYSDAFNGEKLEIHMVQPQYEYKNPFTGVITTREGIKGMKPPPPIYPNEKPLVERTIDPETGDQVTKVDKDSLITYARRIAQIHEQTGRCDGPDEVFNTGAVYKPQDKMVFPDSHTSRLNASGPGMAQAAGTGTR